MKTYIVSALLFLFVSGCASSIDRNGSFFPLFQPEPANQAPVAMFSYTQKERGEACEIFWFDVALDASESFDPDGEVVSHTWVISSVMDTTPNLKLAKSFFKLSGEEEYRAELFDFSYNPFGFFIAIEDTPILNNIEEVVYNTFTVYLATLQVEDDAGAVDTYSKRIMLDTASLRNKNNQFIISTKPEYVDTLLEAICVENLAVLSL